MQKYRATSFGYQYKQPNGFIKTKKRIVYRVIKMIHNVSTQDINSNIRNPQIIEIKTYYIQI